MSLFSQAKGRSFVGVSGESGCLRESSGTGSVGVESTDTGAGDVGVDACVTIFGGSGLTIDVDASNLGGPSPWDFGVGDVGLEEVGLGEEGLEEVKLKKDMVMLLLSVGLLFFVGVGLTASAFGRLIFLCMGFWVFGCGSLTFSSSSLASSSKVVREFDDTDLSKKLGYMII